jgi:hypothetical protein
MAGLVLAIHVFGASTKIRRGCPATPPRPENGAPRRREGGVVLERVPKKLEPRPAWTHWHDDRCLGDRDRGTTPPAPWNYAPRRRALDVAPRKAQIVGPLSGANRKTFAHFETYRF